MSQPDFPPGTRVRTATGKYGTVLEVKRDASGKRVRPASVVVALDRFCARYAGEAPPHPHIALTVAYLQSDLARVEVAP